MSDPVRIQRRRTKGWRMPEGAVYVGRPTCWGNLFAVSGASPVFRAVAVEAFRDEVTRALAKGETPSWVHERWNDQAGNPLSKPWDWLHPLRGRSLACWCPPGPCHADVLLKLANAPLRCEAPNA